MNLCFIVFFTSKYPKETLNKFRYIFAAPFVLSKRPLGAKEPSGCLSVMKCKVLLMHPCTTSRKNHRQEIDLTELSVP